MRIVGRDEARTSPLLKDPPEVLQHALGPERAERPMTHPGATTLDLVLLDHVALAKRKLDPVAAGAERLDLDPIGLAGQDAQRAAQSPARLVPAAQLVCDSAWQRHETSSRRLSIECPLSLGTWIARRRWRPRDVPATWREPGVFDAAPDKSHDEIPF